MEFNLSSVQFGLDIATSLAILGSLGTFLYKQKQKSDQDKAYQLDASVRTVAAEQLQNALHTLSRRFINEVVNVLNMPSNIFKNDMEKVELHFSRQEGLSSKILDQFSEASEALSSFVDEVHAYKYQLYPLLDTLRNSDAEISEFKHQLDSLINLYNDLHRSATPLARELERLLAFCSRNPYDSLDEAQTDELIRLSSSIMTDSDYAYWVNSFIPENDEAAYWDDNHNNRLEVRKKAMQNFILHAYEHPNRLRSQVFMRVYFRYQEGRIMCKKFLIMLAAINHTLLCREGTDSALKSPSKTTERYEGKRYFALDTEVR